MVVLGLGSNLGDRLANLRQALVHLKKITGLVVTEISPVYLSDALLPPGAPPDWNQAYLNLAIRCETKLTPLDLLHHLKQIEQTVGREVLARHWGPRVLDIDILAWDDLIVSDEKLSIPHKGLLERPFALWPLADVAPRWINPSAEGQDKTASQLVEKWGSRFDGNAPLHTRQIYQRIDTPQLVGILNVTPDSFSDSGQYMQVDKALAQAKSLMLAGAEIIDIGAESTAPKAQPLSADKEWERLYPVIEALQSSNDFLLPPKISIDTRHAETASLALEKKVDWINDVTGFENPRMRELVAAAKVDCVMMHHLSIPASREHILPADQDPVKLVYDWGVKRIEELMKAGVAQEKIIFDPGIGFGKTPNQSMALIKHAQVFKQLGTRVLYGHSRKSFLSLFTDYPPQERDPETVALTLYLAKQSVDYLRVHNVEINSRGLRLASAAATV